MDNVEKDQLLREREAILHVVKGLAIAEVDYIIVGGAPMMYVKGPGEDKRFLAEIKKITSIPATTDITCTMDAFNRLGAKKIAIATPMSNAMNEKLKIYLEHEGYQVLSIKNIEGLRNVDCTRLPLETSYKLSKEAFQAAPDAEAIYLPCALWPVLENIEAIENDFRVPVVTCFTAKMWAAMDTLKIRHKIRGYGKLLESLGD
ncbi:MAG: hypothetical protein HYU75_09885 [Betaproteobacteria bacterium]|nr:hypothetical protein [Betaproteobacteria bacterium]